MARTQQPPVNYLSKGAGAMKFLMVDPENDVWLLTSDGAPAAGTDGDGAGWAGNGSLCVDRTNGVLYINTNTLASPTWTVVGTQS